MINAGEFTITSGIYFGKEHVFVTHRPTGKQWVSNDATENLNPGKEGMALLAASIVSEVVEFFPEHELSCDSRFWSPVYSYLEPSSFKSLSEFDALTFLGD